MEIWGKNVPERVVLLGLSWEQIMQSFVGHFNDFSFNLLCVK